LVFRGTTIHEVLLERADSDGARTAAHAYPFVLGGARACCPGNLEKRFGAPVLEAYGLTEAAHQVASNPLPPRPHKPGTSVGLESSSRSSMRRAGTCRRIIPEK